MPRRLAAAVGLVVMLGILASSTPAHAAPGDVVWSRTWNASTPGMVLFAQTAAKPGGGLYVAATTLRASGNVDIVVLRFAANGARRWVRYYDGPAHGIDLMRGLAVDGRGNVLVCGSSQSVLGHEDWVVLKYAPDGRRRWRRTLAGVARGTDEPSAIAVDARRDVVVVGTLTRRATGGDWCVAKYSPGGALRWRTTMTRRVVGLDQALAVAVDPGSRHLFVTGRMYASSTGDDVVTVRYRPDGRRVWRHRWDGDGGPDRGVAIDVSKGGVAVAGVTHRRTAGDDGLVLRLRKAGGLRWAQTVDGGQGTDGADRLHAVGIDNAGNLVAGGSITTSPGHGADFVVVRYLASGAAAGGLQLAAPGTDDVALAVLVTPAGKSFAAGVVNQGRGNDAVAAGLATDGAPLWPVVWHDRAGRDEEAHSLAITAGAVYVAGVSGPDLLVFRVAR